MTRRYLWAIGAAGVVLLAVFCALVFGPAWALLPPGLSCIALFVTAEETDATPRS